MSLTVNRQNYETASCELDRILELQFTVVQIAMGQNNSRKFIVFAGFFRNEKNSAHDFTIDFNFRIYFPYTGIFRIS